MRKALLIPFLAAALAGCGDSKPATPPAPSATATAEDELAGYSSCKGTLRRLAEQPSPRAQGVTRSTYVVQIDVGRSFRWSIGYDLDRWPSI
jgi:nitrous oxide reductase accessory protein NosL